MAKKTIYHSEFSKLPATGFRARELGETYYFTGKKCLKEHLSPRYASSGNCVECISNSRGKAMFNKRGRSKIRSDENQQKAIEALSKGFREYTSTKACPNGHYVRYATSNNCIQCDIEKRKKRSDLARWARIKKEYQLTKKDVDEMMLNQKNNCAICEININDGYHIDHCHKTNKVRKLLCSKCNQAIGLLNEDKSLFFKAAKYLGEHNAS